MLRSMNLPKELYFQSFKGLFIASASDYFSLDEHLIIFVKTKGNGSKYLPNVQHAAMLVSALLHFIDLNYIK